MTPQQLDDLEVPVTQTNILQECPDNWGDIRSSYRQANKCDRSLVLAYSPDESHDATEVWQQLIGIVKYLVRTQKQVSKLQLQTKLKIGDRAFYLGLQALKKAGFKCNFKDNLYQFYSESRTIDSNLQAYIDSFILGIKEERFQQQYFYKVPLSTISGQILNH